MADACVLDTHAWPLCVGEPGRLPRRARRVVGRASTRHVPATCIWEVALLHQHGRFQLADADADIEVWLRQALADPVRIAPLTPEVAVVAARLEDEGFHRDPSDRLIYATARVLDLPLVTRDTRIHAFEYQLPRRTRRLAVWD